MYKEKKPTDYSFHILVNGKGFHSGHDNGDVAQAVAERLNTEADTLGITSRYAVFAKVDSDSRRNG